jgi:hypothetical protein
MTGALLALAVLVAMGVTGVGIALCLPRVAPGAITLVFESVAIGVLVQELIGFVALRTGHYSATTVFGLTLTVLVVSCALAWWRRHRGGGIAPATRAIGRVRLSTSGLLVGVVLAVLVGVALLIRQGPSYFIFQTGDMGEYVNDANILVNKGVLSASFPHGFTLFLSGTHLLFGPTHTVAGVPALGVMLVLGVVAYGRAVALHPVAVLAITAIVVAHPVTVWFSLFPVSESLYAVLLVAALYLVAQARARVSYGYAALAGLTMGVMLLVRGNAMLLAPIVVVALLASAAVDDERILAVQRVFSVVALVALAGAYAYDVRYPRHYFVTTQLNSILPRKVFRLADRVRLLNASPALVVAVALGLVAVLGAALLVTRYVRPRVIDRTVAFWRVAYAAAIGSTLLALVFVHRAGLVDAMARWGPVLVGLTVLGLAALVARPGRTVDGVNGWLLVLVVCSYSLLFAARVPMSKPSAYYLYYDRYLFSEVLPAALLVAAVGVHTIIATYRSVVRARVAVRIAIVALAVVAALAFVPDLAETHRVTKYPLLGDSYQTIDRLDALTRVAGIGAVVYSSPVKKPTGWFFPNTYRAFALPLVQTFRRVVVGLPKGAFDPDEPRDPDAARALLRRSGFDHGYLVSRHEPGTPRPTTDSRTRLVGTVDYVSPILRRSADRSPSSFELVPMQFDVYVLSR